ncbi:DUF3093 domain-containing protein [Williamsia deligens]|uniref:DUF3093 domain-containing protein n=1 Tax=Williamsia deligens TaxID=321325 RepID=A0ABW3GCC2_9NOCA|nr:DUF3093 domain-containing protein [Williamsia deligens]MCP2195395.1 Protein of unknown function (DUF3093) [Williamsia deligens]
MSDQHATPPPAATPSQAGDRFSERLTVPLWWWGAGLVVTGVLGYEIQLAARHATVSFIAYPLVAALAAWLIWSMGRVQVRVAADGELWANKAHLPASVIARTASIPETAKSAALGRQLDPAAYLMHRAWVKTMVLIVLDDPDDPTPYWLVSTRRPGELIAALGFTDASQEPPEPRTPSA